MLTPEYLAALPAAILAIFGRAEEAIIADMARKIVKYDFFLPAADWQNQKLREAGVVQDAILSRLAEITGKTDSELRRMMQEAGSLALKTDTETYAAAGLNVPSFATSEPLLRILNAGYKRTQTTMHNLCRTTALNGHKQFIRAIDDAWMQVNSGGFDVNTAVRNAITGLAEKGIDAISYPTGHVDKMDVAVRRAVVTGINQTACELQLELAEEVGCDLVEVSAHAGARPSHAEWQGRIFSLSGKHPKYPDFRSGTGYGTGEGLGGWNCRHTFGPYIEGSKPVWSEEELEKLNEPTIDYDGRKITEYEASQIQRYNERQIRRWKREEAALDAVGEDSSEAAAKVRAWQKRQAEFLEGKDLKRQYERENIPMKVTKEQPDYLRNNLPKHYRDERNVGSPIGREELGSILKYAKERGVRIGVDGNHTGGFEHYCGDPKTLRLIIDRVDRQIHSSLFLSADVDSVILMYDYVLGYEGDGSKIDVGCFAETIGRTIRLNKFMFDDSAFLEREYNEAVESGLFVRGTTFENVVDHEIGHIIDRKTAGLYSRILSTYESEARRKGLPIDDFIEKYVSGYAAAKKRGQDKFGELVAETNSLLHSAGNEAIIELLQKGGVV